MGDDLEIKIIEAPGDPIGDKCDRCGKVMNPNVDGCLLHVATNKLYCVACALEREGMSRDEITPELVECTRQEIDKTFPDIVIKGDAIPALLESTIETAWANSPGSHVKVFSTTPIWASPGSSSKPPKSVVICANMKETNGVRTTSTKKGHAILPTRNLCFPKGSGKSLVQGLRRNETPD